MKQGEGIQSRHTLTQTGVRARMPFYGNCKTSSPRFASGLWLQETLYFAGRFALPGLLDTYVTGLGPSERTLVFGQLGTQNVLPGECAKNRHTIICHLSVQYADRTTLTLGGQPVWATGRPMLAGVPCGSHWCSTHC